MKPDATTPSTHLPRGHGEVATPDQADRALRAIAAFEAFKGALAVAASLGLLGLLHHDLHTMAASLISHVGLDPGARYPALLLHDIDLIHRSDLWPLMAAAWAYALLRGAEAWGLWRQRRWGAWIGALSGLLYLPFELRHLMHQATWVALAVLLFNLAVVAFLAWKLWRRGSTSGAPLP